MYEYALMFDYGGWTVMRLDKSYPGALAERHGTYVRIEDALSAIQSESGSTVLLKVITEPR